MDSPPLKEVTLTVTTPPRQLKRDQNIEVDQRFIEKPIRKIQLLYLPSSSELEVALKELDDQPRFGPFYAQESQLMSTFKDAAWQHILSRSPGTETETTDTYTEAVRRVSRQAMDTYSDVSGVHNHPLFVRMMMKDGCFILQMAFFLLGGAPYMNYPSNHLLFGEIRTNLMIKRWSKSLFFVGNQVPQVVLKELMKQSFFQQVLSSGSLKRPSDSFGRALYDLLLEPEYKNLGIFKSLISFTTKSRFPQLHARPSDLLHGLHMHVTGAQNEDSDEEEEEDYETERDLESNNEDSTDNITDSVRCATDLIHSGIHFRAAKGIRGIEFNFNIFRAVLALPVLEVDENTQVMFKYLQNYEITHSREMKEQEVRSYIQFMSELILTSDDVNVLCRHGIIRANRQHRKTLPAILRNLAGGNSTLKHRNLRFKIDDYSRPPWDKFRNYLSIVVLLTLLQTVYTVLSYYKN